MQRHRNSNNFMRYLLKTVFSATVVLTLKNFASADDSDLSDACPASNYKIDVIEPSALDKLFGRTSRDARLFKDDVLIADLAINWNKLEFSSFDKKTSVKGIEIYGVGFLYRELGKPSIVDSPNILWGQQQVLSGFFVPADQSNRSNSQIYYLLPHGRNLAISVDYSSRITFEKSLQDVLCIVSSPQIRDFKL